MKEHVKRQLDKHLARYKYNHLMIRKFKHKLHHEFKIIDRLTHGKAKKILHEHPEEEKIIQEQAWLYWRGGED